MSNLFLISKHILTELDKIQKQAEIDNVHLTSEVFVVNSQGQLFGQKRSSDRRLFPDAWDVPGGHHDEGETLLHCIERELREETNWDLQEIVTLLGVEDWEVPVESTKTGDNPYKRMFKVLVKVKNVDELILEEGKVSESMWFDNYNLERLLEGRSSDTWRRDSFLKVLEYIQINNI
jgi:8-oxo-dGTP diphosphatase